MGWLLVEKDPKVAEAGKKLDMSDLDKDPVVYFQKSLDPWFRHFMCFVFPSLVAFYGWNESIWVRYHLRIFQQLPYQMAAYLCGK